jgi:non-ribosomal peptide synthetase component F
MFVTWEAGACVCCATQKQTIKPDAYIKDARLSVWFSVPGTAVFMRRLGTLKPEMYPHLRLSLFCGEALPAEVARQWALAAPNSVIENLYGPTELTIACTQYRWDSERSPGECERGIVPIGMPLPGMHALIVDSELREVPDGTDGELLMTGPQLSLGYWQDKHKTEQTFVRISGREPRYYRTGDRVRRPGPNEPLLYLGRIDNQVKVLGHRIELGEIEAVIRQLSGVQGVVALGWPVTEGGADGIEVFLESERLDIGALTMQLRQKLPVYMLPRNIRVIDRFPVNANGKYDRKALEGILQSSCEERQDRQARARSVVG